MRTPYRSIKGIVSDMANYYTKSEVDDKFSAIDGGLNGMKLLQKFGSGSSYTVEGINYVYVVGFNDASTYRREFGMYVDLLNFDKTIRIPSPRNDNNSYIEIKKTNNQFTIKGEYVGVYIYGPKSYPTTELLSYEELRQIEYIEDVLSELNKDSQSYMNKLETEGHLRRVGYSGGARRESLDTRPSSNDGLNYKIYISSEDNWTQRQSMK